MALLDPANPVELSLKVLEAKTHHALCQHSYDPLMSVRMELSPVRNEIRERQDPSDFGIYLRISRLLRKVDIQLDECLQSETARIAAGR